MPGVVKEALETVEYLFLGGSEVDRERGVWHNMVVTKFGRQMK